MGASAGTGKALAWAWVHQWSTWGAIKYAYVASGLPWVYARRTRVGAQKLRMHTVRPTTCSNVAPMARGGAGDIPGNGSGQDNTSSSTYTHVQGAYGAPTGVVAGAADGRRTQFVRARTVFF